MNGKLDLTPRWHAEDTGTTIRITVVEAVLGCRDVSTRFMGCSAEWASQERWLCVYTYWYMKCNLEKRVVDGVLCASVWCNTFRLLSQHNVRRPLSVWMIQEYTAFNSRLEMLYSKVSLPFALSLSRPRHTHTHICVHVRSPTCTCTSGGAATTQFKAVKYICFQHVLADNNNKR